MLITIYRKPGNEMLFNNGLQSATMEWRMHDKIISSDSIVISILLLQAAYGVK